MVAMQLDVSVLVRLLAERDDAKVWPFEAEGHVQQHLGKH
jgi:hypothetical protein